MVSSTEQSLPIALDLYAAYYRNRDRNQLLPRDLTLRLLTHEVLFQPGEIGRFQSAAYEWASIGKGFFRDHPQDALQIAEIILRHFGEIGTIVEGFNREAQSLLSEIARQFPEQVWTMVSRSMEHPEGANAFRVRAWLRGADHFKPGEGAMIEAFPSEKIWEWVDGNPGRRALILANVVPPTLVGEGGQTTQARELLVRFGNREDVRTALRRNSATGGWTGPISSHLTSKKVALLEFQSTETDANVRNWIDDYVESLDRQIQDAIIQEEREQD